MPSNKNIIAHKMKRIDLAGKWIFKAIDRYRTLPKQKRSVKTWMKATVPGTVHTDLIASGEIPDPFYRTNELDVQWVDSLQWLYRREFVVPPEFLRQRRIRLVTGGLDTYARVTVNGNVVGETSSMFVEHTFDVKRWLKVGKNVIEILFDSPTVRAMELERRHGRLKVALEPHRVYVRKAQYSFGWDWGPKLVTSGIWRNICLEASSYGRIRNPWVKVVSANNKAAVLEISAEIERVAQKGEATVRVAVENGSARIDREARVTGNIFRLRITVPRPRLWWPNGYGEQPISTAWFSLLQDGEEVDSVSVPFGIRTVRLLQQKDSRGKTFIFEINGVKIFCKGANWIPADSFLPRVAGTIYERLLTLARDSHINMVRVWGGGIYEQELFYAVCDRLGLMVWQDFMFACGEYPEQQWFLSEVEREAQHIVKRLRNHPSLVLWCGNNECEWLFCTENGGKMPDDMKGSKIFRDILPSAIRRHDGTRPYWRTSPFGEGFPNDESSGNHHQWSVWSAWKDFREYENDHARFVTEFGFQAPAYRKTFESVTLPSDRSPQSVVLEHHNKQTEGTERLFRFQAAHYRPGTTFDEFIFKGQLVQAEALKCAVEHWRRRKFQTAGALFWQLNDCWPVSSWSVIDSDLRPKAAWFYARRFFAPVLVSVCRKGDTVEVWGTNDLLHSVKGMLEVSLWSFERQTDWRKETSVLIPQNSSRLIHRFKLADIPPIDPARHYFRVRLEDGKAIQSENRLFLAEPKHLNLPEVMPTITISKEDGAVIITCSTNAFLKNVYLELDGSTAPAEDNYFDLDAGETKGVRIQTDRSISEIENQLTVYWLEKGGEGSDRQNIPMTIGTATQRHITKGVDAP